MAASKASMLGGFGKGKAPAEEPLPMLEEDEAEDTGGYELAAQEVLDAVKGGDATALSDALKGFVDMCKAQG